MTEPTPKIDQAGVYDLPAEVYHADPVQGGSLSSTGARKLLPPSCPALYKAWADNPEEHKRAFDLGQAAHAEVLGMGRPLRVIDAADYKTTAAQQAKKDAYAANETPVLVREYEQVKAMAAAIRAHPIASALFDPASGQPEQTLIWREHGIWRRAMLDWLPNPPAEGQRLIVPDYKTAISVEPGDLRKAMDRHQLHLQDAWYRDGVRALGLDGGRLDPAFVFVFQMKTPPYLVTVAQPDPDAQLWGSRMNRHAIDIYRRCTTTGQWPGYADGVVSLELPVWTTRELEDAWEAGLYRPTREAAAA